MVNKNNSTERSRKYREKAKEATPEYSYLELTNTDLSNSPSVEEVDAQAYPRGLCPPANIVLEHQASGLFRLFVNGIAISPYGEVGLAFDVWALDSNGDLDKFARNQSQKGAK
jgi:hypothetical protein